MNKTKLASIGAVLGIPLSYYFQSDYVQMRYSGIFEYLKNFDSIVSKGDRLFDLFLGVVIFAILGWVLGFVIEKLK